MDSDLPSMHLFRRHKDVRQLVAQQLPSDAVRADPCETHHLRLPPQISHLPSPSLPLLQVFVEEEGGLQVRVDPPAGYDRRWPFPVEPTLAVYEGQLVVLRSNVDAENGHMNMVLYKVGFKGAGGGGEERRALSSLDYPLLRSSRSRRRRRTGL